MLIKKEEIRTYLARSWSVSWPMTLIMFFEFLIGLTDVYIAGKIGKEVQATYGLVMQFYFIMIVIANALTVGTVSVVSRLYTAGDKRKLNETVFSAMLATAGAGAALAVVGFLLAPWIIRVLNIPEGLKPYGIPLIRIYTAGLFFHYLLITSNGILRSGNRVRTSMRTQALVCLLNVGLNFLLVFHTTIGFQGIALSTVCSVFAGAMVNLFHLRRDFLVERSFRLSAVGRMFRIGWPMGLLQVFWQLSSMVLYLILSALPEHPVETLAALTAGLRIESAIFLPAFAFNMANAVIVGNLLGAGKKEEAFRSGLVTAGIGVGIVSFLVVLVVVNAGWILSFLSTNALVRQEGIRYIYISMISEPFMALGTILGGGLTASGDTRSLLLRVALSLWLVRIPLSYACVVHFGFGPAAVWWAMNLSQGVSAFLIAQRYLGRKWM